MTSFVNPGPWVDPEKVETEPWRTQGGIVKFLEFPVRLPAMSRRAFHLYWQKHHSANVMNITAFAQFMRKYNSGHRYLETPPGLPPHYDAATPFEGAAEVWVNSLGEVGDWLGNPLYEQLIRPDELRFISQEGAVEIVVGKEERLYEPSPDWPENERTKVYLLTRRATGAGYDDFHAAASLYGKAILAAETLKRRLSKLVITHKLREPYPEGMTLHDIDAVVEFWFDSPQAIAPFFREAAYRDAIAPMERDIFSGGLRAVVAKMRVVHDEFSFQPSTTQPLPFSW